MKIIKPYESLLNFWFKLPQGLRFLLLGGYNFIFNNALFSFIVYVGIDYTIALVSAWFVGVINNTVMFKYFLFQNKKNFLTDLIRSYTTYFGILISNYILLYISVDIYKFNIYISQIIIAIILAILTYFIFKIFTFKAK